MEKMIELMSLYRALSDENRIKALMMLHDGEVCAYRIVEVLGLAASTVSAHMAILHRAGLITVRKEGRKRLYSLMEKDASPIARKTIGLLIDFLKNEQVIAKMGSAGKRCSLKKTIATY